MENFDIHFNGSVRPTISDFEWKRKKQEREFNFKTKRNDDKRNKPLRNVGFRALFTYATEESDNE
jgi:hypothetical protein